MENPCYVIYSYDPKTPGIKIEAEVYGKREANEQYKIIRSSLYGNRTVGMRTR